MAHPWDTNWSIERTLGSGGQGVTRLVNSMTTEGRVGVLKYLKNNKSPAARARMRREVASLQSLNSLGGDVPAVYEHNTGSFEDAKVELFLVMEFFDGPTLAEYIEQNGRLSVDAAIDFTLDLSATISIAHTEGILHRDLKPDNIVVKDAQKSDLGIVDYGLSFNAEDEDLTETMETFRNKFLDLPETNTPGGNRRDPRSDVTALCAVFFYMLSGHRSGQLQDATGKMPHMRADSLLRNAVAEDRRVAQLELLLSQGLSPQLAGRFQSLDELTSRLLSIRNQDSATQTSDPVSTAKALSSRLRELDRKTQIAEFEQPAKQLLNKFARNINKLGSQLGRFELVAAQGGNKGPQLPVGLDPVAGSYQATLSVRHHNVGRHRIYKVASRGEQCVVCVSESQVDQQSGKPTFSDWAEIGWYDESTNAIMATLESELHRWLDDRLNELASEVLTT